MAYKIIPAPKKIKVQKGQFRISGKLWLYSNAELNYIPPVIENILKNKEFIKDDSVKGYQALITKKKSSALIKKKFISKPENDEHYLIKITPDGMILSALSSKGLLRAFATLQCIIRENGKVLECCEIEDWPDLGLRGSMVCLHQIHDFLPYFAPNMNGFKLLLDRMFEAKLNHLLIEYEAMYPWSGKHAEISSKHALKNEEVTGIINEAADRGIEIMPLVQTLGHVYHLLIHEQYKKCEESPEYPQQLCPLKDETFKLVCELIDDVIRLHPGSRYIHLGGDECRQLGVCPDCAEFVKKNGKYKLYAQFYKKVTDYVAGKGFIPVLWHDIAVKQPEVLRDFNKKVVFHFWNYGDISHGPMDVKFEILRKEVGSERIIGGPAARAEAPNGAVMPSMRIIQNNVMEMNKRISGANAVGSIITDWPDTGISFLETVLPIFMQGEFTWNAGRQPACEFRRNYTFFRFGADVPELLEMQDAIYGCTPFAMGIQTQLKSYMNRYEFAPYDFNEHLERFMESVEMRKSPVELYQLFHKRHINTDVVLILEDLLKRDVPNRIELEVQLLTARTNLLFTTLTLGLAFGYYVLKHNAGWYHDLAVKEIGYYLKNESFVKGEFSRIYEGYTVMPHLKNYLEMLFKPEIRKGASNMISSIANK